MENEFLFIDPLLSMLNSIQIMCKNEFDKSCYYLFTYLILVIAQQDINFVNESAMGAQQKKKSNK